MRDYKQMQEIQRLRKQQENQPADAPEDGNAPESSRYSHRAPGFRGWASYIAEYYKWPILIGLIIAVGLVIGISQLNRSSNPDLCCMYVGPYYLSPAEQDRMKEALAALDEKAGLDFNNDGEFRFDFLDITVTHLQDADGKKYTYDDQNTAYTRFQTEIRAGDTSLYFLEPYYYRQILAEGILYPLSELGVDESLSFDGYGIYLGELECYELAGLSRMPAETVVCLRRSPADDAIDYGRTVENWEHHREVLQLMLQYRSETPEPPVQGDPAVTLFFAGEQTLFRSIRLPLEETLTDLLPNGYGKLTGIPRYGSAAQLKVVAKEIRTELVTGDAMLLLLDREAFEYAVQHDLLEELPEGLAGDAAAQNGFGLRLSGLRLSQAGGFRELPSDSILCLRKDPAQQEEAYGRTEASFAVAKALFLQLAAYSGE